MLNVCCSTCWGLPRGSADKESTSNAGDVRSIQLLEVSNSFTILVSVFPLDFGLLFIAPPQRKSVSYNSSSCDSLLLYKNLAGTMAGIGGGEHSVITSWSH